MLSNAYFFAKFRFDTAENEPAKNLQKFAKFSEFANFSTRYKHATSNGPAEDCGSSSAQSTLSPRCPGRPTSPPMLQRIALVTSRTFDGPFSAVSTPPIMRVESFGSHLLTSRYLEKPQTIAKMAPKNQKY